MDLDPNVLPRLRRGLATAQAISIGLSAQIVEAARYHATLAMQAREAARRAEQYPREVVPDGTTREDLEERRALRAQQRSNELAALRQLTRNPEVHNVERVAAEFASHMRPEASDFHHAATVAAEAAERAAAALRQLEDERGRHGRAGGLLRQSIDQAEQWLQSQGIVQTEAA